MGGNQRTNKEDQSLSRGRKTRCDGMHAMNNGGFEVDIEDAEHVNGVKNHTQDNQPSLSPLQPIPSTC